MFWPAAGVVCATSFRACCASTSLMSVWYPTRRQRASLRNCASTFGDVEAVDQRHVDAAVDLDGLRRHAAKGVPQAQSILVVGTICR